ncbi:MAG: HD domain-containing protein [Patescibacteria group bacterium]|mgnify:CR=1 FL=1
MEDIPKEIVAVVALLQHEGFEAHLVGGCVRDILMHKSPKDWDVTTNAKPEDIIRIFPKTFYENEYGTVGVVVENAPDASLAVVEVTPYRKEGKYSDKRHPDSVSFGATLDEDLARRDFTVNAIAYDALSETLTDPYDGHKDIKEKILRAVGEPGDRFSEDALRIMRGARLAAELDFDIEPKTSEAMQKRAETIAQIAAERVRDEFSKLLMSEHPRKGLELLYELGLLLHIFPEIEEGVNVKQNQAHAFPVFEHLVRTLQASADKNATLPVRLAALFHDVGKPPTRIFDDKKDDWTFHGHDMVGMRIAVKRLQALRYGNDVIEKVAKLIRWHMFFSDTEQITHSAVRRLIRNVGPENVEDLLLLRVCDRIGTGRPKEQPYRLRKYKSMIDEVLRDPISVSMLAVKGEDVMKMLNENPGPRIGYILHTLLEDVLDDPTQNTPEYLEKRAKELAALPHKELEALAEKAKETKEGVEAEEIKKIRSKHFVE